MLGPPFAKDSDTIRSANYYTLHINQAVIVFRLYYKQHIFGGFMKLTQADIQR